MNHDGITNASSKMGLLFFAILPVTERNETIFLLDFLLIILCFMVAIITHIILFKKDKNHFYKMFLGQPKDNLINTGICIAGIIIALSLEDKEMLYVWILFCVLSLVSLLPNDKTGD